MRYTNNVLEFDKNGKRYASKFDGIKADAFIYDSFNAFKIIDGIRSQMTDAEKKIADDFVTAYEIIVPFSEKKIKKIQNAKDLRKRAENQGIIVANMRIDTSRESQAMINSTYTFLKENPTSTLNWKTENGFVQIGLTEISAIATAVGKYIQECFNAEYENVKAIEACTTEEELNAVKLQPERSRPPVPGETPITIDPTPAV